MILGSLRGPPANSLYAVYAHLLLDTVPLHHCQGVIVSGGEGEVVDVQDVQEQGVVVHSVACEL